MTSPSALVAARRHPDGYLEARPHRASGRRGRMLAGFLQSNLQGDAAAARALLAEIAAVRRGEPPQPGSIGNAFAIRIAADGAALRNVILDDAPPEHYRLDELGAALEAWLAAIERGRGDAG
jgi:hypothetical protein